MFNSKLKTGGLFISAFAAGALAASVFFGSNDDVNEHSPETQDSIDVNIITKNTACHRDTETGISLGLAAIFDQNMTIQISPVPKDGIVYKTIIQNYEQHLTRGAQAAISTLSSQELLDIAALSHEDQIHRISQILNPFIRDAGQTESIMYGMIKYDVNVVSAEFDTDAFQISFNDACSTSSQDTTRKDTPAITINPHLDSLMPTSAPWPLPHAAGQPRQSALHL